MNKIKKSFLAILLIIVSPVSYPDSTDQGRCKDMDPVSRYWLDKVLCKVQDVKHAGVVVAERDSGLDLYRVENGALGTMNSNSLSILTGGGERSILDESSESCTYRAKLNKSSLACHISGSYRVSVAGPGMVSGRTSVVLSLGPRDQHRYRYRLEIDKKTGLLLGMKTFTLERRLLENFSFATVDIDESVREQRPAEANRAKDIEVEKRTHWFSNLELGWVPNGFESNDLYAARTNSRNFTDGLASFTIFVEPRNENLPPNVRSSVVWGSTASHVIARKVEDSWFTITVIGDIPTSTARRIARSVRWSS